MSQTLSEEESADLAEALKENKKATDTVREVADDLAVVHTVLDTGVPKRTLPPDVDRAVEQTAELEKQLRESSENLKKVNESLKREVEKRAS